MEEKEEVFTWPECFITGTVEQNTELQEALALAMIGLAAIAMEEDPPDNFNRAMAQLSNITECLTPRDFAMRAQQLHWNESNRSLH